MCVYMCMYPCIYVCMHICIYTHICIIIYFLISRLTYIILGISPRVVVYPSLMLSSCHFLRLLVNRGHPDYPQSPVHVGEHLLSTYYTYSLDLPSSVLFFRHTWPQTFVLRLFISYLAWTHQLFIFIFQKLCHLSIELSRCRPNFFNFGNHETLFLLIILYHFSVWKVRTSVSLLFQQHSLKYPLNIPIYIKCIQPISKTTEKHVA